MDIWKPIVLRKTREEYKKTKLWKARRSHILQRDQHKCIKCSSSYCLQVHHKKYMLDCGLDKPENLETLCASCHSRVHSLDENYNNGEIRRSVSN